MARDIETEPGKVDAGGYGKTGVAAAPPPERTTPPAAAPRHHEPPARRRSFAREHPFALVVGSVLLVIAAIGGVWLWNYLSSYESTDDAEIDGHIYPISARIPGRVTAVNFDINQPVKAGQALVQLDPTDYKVALERAKADLAEAQADAQAASTQVPITRTNTGSQTLESAAGVRQAEAAVSAAEQQYIAAQARIREAEANYVKAQKDVDRFRPLVAKQEISQQQFDQAVATANALSASVDTARANADAAQRQVNEARARVEQARAQQAATASAPQQIASQRARAVSEQAKAQSEVTNVQDAMLNLQYTTIASPVAGIIGRRAVEVGQQIQPGQELMAVVPLTDLWVTANYKETQLRNMRVGQAVTVHVDAVDRDFKAHVDSFPATSGSRMSLLPPENATGNFVKVVQRLPVKIVFDSGEDTKRLRPGMSVETKVWIK